MLDSAFTRSILSVALCAAGGAGQGWVRLDGPIAAAHAAAFDSLRNRLVAFGREGETWEFDGNVLLHRPVPTGLPMPPTRARAAMATDLIRGHVLLFGGLVGTTSLSDTWTWNGDRWTQLSSPVSPPRRIDSSLAYDVVRDRLVLFGGQELGVAPLFDTWEHDGSQWSQVTTATVPNFANGPKMTFDLARAVCVMVSHPGLQGAPLQTWEYDGVDWRLRAPAGPVPVARSNASLAYDFARGRTVLIGGANNSDEVWEWDGTAWTLAATLPGPFRMDAAAYFDPTIGQVVVVGGQEPGANVRRTDAWTWDGIAMTRLRDDHCPPTRYGHMWVDDPVRRRAVLFGGRRTGTLDDTWTWDGVAWTRMAPSTVPAVQADAAVAFDYFRSEPLMFGGVTGGRHLDELWAWNGSDWALLAAGGGPSPRSGAGMTCDLGSGVVLLFGGAAGPIYQSASLRNDTWAWNGSAWTQRQTATAPSPREGPALAYDIGRARTVLFGGRTGATLADQLGDTWEWDGAQWQRITPTTSPPALLSPSLAFDPLRQRIVLAGVSLGGGINTLELWDYDGVTWALIDRTASALAESPGLVWDPQRLRLVLYDGNGVSEWTNRRAAVDSFGTGCGAQPPVLMARARPRIGDPEFGLETRVRPGLPVLFALAGGPGSAPLGTCTLLLGRILASTIVVADSAGMAVQPIPLPLSLSLRGLVLHGQGGVLDPLAPQGFMLTQGLRLSVGD